MCPVGVVFQIPLGFGVPWGAKGIIHWAFLKWFPAMHCPGYFVFLTHLVKCDLFYSKDILKWPFNPYCYKKNFFWGQKKPFNYLSDVAFCLFLPPPWGKGLICFLYLLLLFLVDYFSSWIIFSYFNGYKYAKDFWCLSLYSFSTP